MRNVSDNSVRSAAAVIGVGTTAYGRFPGETCDSLATAALHSALDDAGLATSDLDGLITMRTNGYESFATVNAIEPRWTATVPAEGRMTGPAIGLALSAIATGQANTVALVYGNDGRSGGHSYGGGGARAAQAAEGYGTTPELTAPVGMTSPGAFYALMFQRHSAEFGTSAEALSTIARTFREHAGRNRAAVFRDPLTAEQYTNGRHIVEPLRIYDYCLINDGGVALILTASDRARDTPQPPVYVRAVAQQARLVEASFPPGDYWHSALAAVGSQAYAMAGCGRGDIDVLQVYDNFSPNVLFSLEGLGFCQRGESEGWVRDGHLGLDGDLPTNTSGGHLSESYMQGWALNVEAVRQIRGGLGDRQVDGATLAQYVCAAPIVSSVIYGAEP